MILDSYILDLGHLYKLHLLPVVNGVLKIIKHLDEANKKSSNMLVNIGQIVMNYVGCIMEMIK